MVALRKESVDRNILQSHIMKLIPGSLSARRAWIEISILNFHKKDRQVALRKESVDRNCVFVQLQTVCVQSLSARRAWIEIPLCQLSLQRLSVALRKESVDRNFNVSQNRFANSSSLSARRAWIEISDIEDKFGGLVSSLSARRAWIEIPVIFLCCHCLSVALRKESVDRNILIVTKQCRRICRSPQGERG